ncbi:MAG: chromate transporter [Clostridia bacterium]|nr:chromate transporter [Clostridia bacterium]
MDRSYKSAPKNRIRDLFALFFSFLKIGAFTFGGGYAMIPLIQKEAGEKRGWINDKDLLEILAVAESTPGPIAINSATFIGCRVAGVPGALCATLGVALPSFLILFALTHVLSAFQDLKAVRYAFFGVRAGVLALMLKALVSLFKQCPKDAFSIILIVLSFAGAVALNIFSVSVIYLLLFCALCGLCYTLIRAKGGQK